MDHRVLAGLGVALIALAPSVAVAKEPYYFHKTGIDRDVYMEDVNDCAELAGGVRTAHYRVSATNPTAPYAAISVGVASFFATLVERSEHRRIVSRVEWTCMGDKGYARRSLDEESHEEIRELRGEDRIDRLFGLVSAENPVGKVLVE